jgi:hypothetical protein
MLKDIFIDNNIAKNFCNPVDPEYKNLVVPLNYLDGYIRIAYQSNETAGSLGSKSSSGGKRVSICLRLSRNATGTL